jgi:creatinine amidohydrolase/Fe(II)-dependent formamide hydrolase-like protein
MMRNSRISSIAIALSASFLLASGLAQAATTSNADLVEFEMMTWPEVKDALAAGKTTALFYTGGVEQRGPQNANGGHNHMARAIVKDIALKLGDAIAMPVLPFTPNRANPALPGTIGLTPVLLEGVLEQMAEEAITNGFRNVVLMGDHGGGQGRAPSNIYQRVAERLDEKHRAKGIRVFYCDQVYQPANAAFDKWLESEGYPRSLHGGLVDTSMMMYLDEDGTWVRKDLLPTAVGDLVGADGRPQVGADGGAKNGITGDARRSSAALGKIGIEMKVDYAVRQIREFVPKGE